MRFAGVPLFAVVPSTSSPGSGATLGYAAPAMDDLTIRPIVLDEFPVFLRVEARASHGRYTEEDLERELLIAEPDRCFAALDGDVIVGTAGACSTELTVPGGVSVSAAGITSVGVLPSHRRREINTRLIGELLDQAAERDEPLAYLWASESPIYRRLGFGMASLSAELEISTDRSGFVPGISIEGRVRALPRDEALPLMRSVYDAVAATRAGMIAIDDRWWTWLFFERKRYEDDPLFFAVHEDEGGSPDGYAVYGVKERWVHGVPQHELRLRRWIAATPAAAAALWRYLLDADLIATVKAWDRPADEELLWLVAEPRRLNFMIADGLWMRLIDIPRSLEGRRYAADGRLVFEVDDAFRSTTSGRYELVVEGGQGTCGRTDRQPELWCTVDALSAAYLGGNSFGRLARAQQVRELAPNAIVQTDAMFTSDPSPWFAFTF
jgi:predicted acetyltransferase